MAELTEDQRGKLDDLIELLGVLTDREISKRFGLQGTGPGALRRHLGISVAERVALPEKARKVPMEECREIYDLVVRLGSYSEVGRRMGLISASVTYRVKVWAQANGLPMPKGSSSTRGRNNQAESRKLRGLTPLRRVSPKKKKLVVVLGRNVHRFRKSVGWTQEQLAANVGISRSFVSAIELGSREPNLKIVMALSEVFGCTLDELFFGGHQPGDSSGE